jgi:hypothetical protein
VIPAGIDAWRKPVVQEDTRMQNGACAAAETGGRAPFVAAHSSVVVASRK